MGTETTTVTTRQLDILRHSLGLDDYGRGKMFRNHFVAGGDDEVACRSCVAEGWMVEGRRSDLTGGDPVFFVTDAGKKLATSDLRIPGDCLIQLPKRSLTDV